MCNLTCQVATMIQFISIICYVCYIYKIIIYISHFLNEIQELCDTYVVLRNGTLVGSGNIADETKNNIIRMIIGRDLVASKNQSKKTSSKRILKINNLIKHQSNLIKNQYKLIKHQ